MAKPRPLRLGDPPQLGVYRLEGRLGEGGQGIVYLERDAEGRQVAVKLLRSHLGQDEAVRARFARELAVIERVAGFCTAQVIDADVVAAVGAWMYAPGRGPADSLALPTGGSEILKIASADARAFESYDYRTFDADARSARSRMTSGLRQQYDSEMTTARPVALKQKIVNVASVVAAGLESTRGARANVLLSLDQRITRAGETPTASQAEVRAALVRRQGQWWLDQVTPLPAAPADLEGASWPGRKVSAVLKAAQSCIRAMYSVDHRAVDGTFTAVRACATGEFRDQWVGSEAQLRSAYVTEQSVSRVRAIDVSPGASTGPSQATVLAAVGTEVRTKTTPSPTKKTVPPMQVTMNRVGGRWLMAKVAYVG
ncbi:hypothetical protein [Actinoallomurus iriomotensis]|uniref:Protein kinase domain-containing protein n=1 Tax=Actinoallomurus iriomotensis TaxID=478107 RepID=A0A9W6VJY0_9ACTN|nr:hypothetical protein [Actinoallomurus iriomotensis]GLY74588.1 hypothetical protein Airi01_028550 [Actinoallomurus iriomotensis]